MTAITTTTTAGVPRTARQHSVRHATLVSGAVGAVATTAVAAAADAAGVPLAIDGEMIPLAGFAQLTAIGAVIGGLLAAVLDRHAARPRATFAWVAAVLTALSCIPSVAMPSDTATTLVLVATHVLAAAIIVPALARQIRR